jgi:hypothetical protein
LDVAKARVHVVVSDRVVRKIGNFAFVSCKNLVKVTAPFVEEVGEEAFNNAFNLRHVSFGTDVVVTPLAFLYCPLLEVLAASVGFELDTGDKDKWGCNDPTVAITRFAKWCNQMDDNEEYYKTAICMIRLCNTPITCSRMRASTDDLIWAFVAGPGRDMAELILSFTLGVKVGKGVLREASKEKLLEVGLELRAIRMDSNRRNMQHWGAVVDGERAVIEGEIREAVRRGLVIEANLAVCWGLRKSENGYVYNVHSTYGEACVVHGRMVDGVVVPVEEGLFAESSKEEDLDEEDY